VHRLSDFFCARVENVFRERVLDLILGLATLCSAAASHRVPFPFRSPRGPCQRVIRTAQPKRGQIKSPSLCQREGTEGRECQYLSLPPNEASPPSWLRGIGHAMLASASHRVPFPLSSLLGSCQREIRTAQPKRGQIKSPSLCQREGTEGRECQYLSLPPNEASPQSWLRGIGHAMLAAASHRAPFPRWGGFKRKEYVLEKDFLQ